MAFDFPASPSEGTVFSPAGGPVYTFTDGVWRILGGPAASIVTTLVTASATYTRPAGLKFLEVTCYGAGGAGGGTGVTGAGAYAGASGGNGGAKSWSLLTATEVGASQAMTIGGGGAGVLGGNGGNGGTTSFGTLVSATGGAGGNAAFASAGHQLITAPATIVSTAGQIRGATQLGSRGQTTAGGFVYSGEGGATDLGGGGRANSIISAAAAGNPGNNYSAAGSGSAAWSGQAVTAGGAGFAGCIILREYF